MGRLRRFSGKLPGYWGSSGDSADSVRLPLIQKRHRKCFNWMIDTALLDLPAEGQAWSFSRLVFHKLASIESTTRKIGHCEHWLSENWPAFRSKYQHKELTGR